MKILKLKTLLLLCVFVWLTQWTTAQTQTVTTTATTSKTTTSQTPNEHYSARGDLYFGEYQTLMGTQWG